MFLRRCLSALILITILIFCTWEAKGKLVIVTFLLVHGLVGLGLMEYYDMMKAKGINVFRRYGTAVGLLFSASIFIAGYFGRLSDDFESLILFFLISSLFLLQGYRKDNASPLVIIAVTLAGILYVAWLFSFYYRIVFYPGVDGRWFVFLVFLVTKSSDIMAYLVGSTVGRHPLAPKISPKKTIEGAVGGLVGAMLAAWLGKIWLVPDVAMPGIFFLGAVMGLVGMAGDLAESLLKRDAQVKDSGNFIPGMGGVLDIFDSLLFTGPVMYFYMRFFVTI